MPIDPATGLLALTGGKMLWNAITGRRDKDPRENLPDPRQLSEDQYKYLLDAARQSKELQKIGYEGPFGSVRWEGDKKIVSMDPSDQRHLDSRRAISNELMSIALGDAYGGAPPAPGPSAPAAPPARIPGTAAPVMTEPGTNYQGGMGDPGDQGGIYSTPEALGGMDPTGGMMDPYSMVTDPAADDYVSTNELIRPENDQPIDVSDPLGLGGMYGNRMAPNGMLRRNPYDMYQIPGGM